MANSVDTDEIYLQRKKYTGTGILKPLDIDLTVSNLMENSNGLKEVC